MASPPSREKTALEETVEELRGEAATSHAEKQSLEARNAELQRSLRQCTEQKEALERQGERGKQDKGGFHDVTSPRLHSTRWARLR